MNIIYTATFDGQEAADLARIIERNMAHRTFIHRLLVCALSLEKLLAPQK